MPARTKVKQDNSSRPAVKVFIDQLIIRDIRLCKGEKNFLKIPKSGLFFNPCVVEKWS